MSDLVDPDALFETVATLFAIAVLADHRIRDVELVEFVHACSVQNLKIRPDTLLSRREILDWFNRHKEKIEQALNSPDHDAYKTEVLSHILDMDLQRSVLSSIFTISICDYELHDEESAFITQALDVWKTSMPLPSEIERVA
jgi:hypothetical protein